MPNYQNGRIYCIRAPGTDEVYIGSTTIPLSKRMVQHRAGYMQWLGCNRSYLSSYCLLERDGAYIELIEEFPCNSKEELNRREGEIMRATANCVNYRCAGRTQKEADAAHRTANKDKINARNRARRAARRAAENSQLPADAIPENS